MDQSEPMELLRAIKQDIARRTNDNQLFDLPGLLEVELAFYRDRERQKKMNSLLENL